MTKYGGNARIFYYTMYGIFCITSNAKVNTKGHCTSQQGNGGLFQVSDYETKSCLIRFFVVIKPIAIEFLQEQERGLVSGEVNTIVGDVMDSRNNGL